ncbi:MAG: hypothetical protein QOF22_1967 [Bradyrhizobium sp.]|jgi:predicted nucleic acid-binding protein|nr:hypothetical protein [Bradyrhizobium sp.]
MTHSIKKDTSEQALNKIAERAVGLRRDHHIKLPDAIIRAHAMLLVARNTKDFEADDPGVRMPYRL